MATWSADELQRIAATDNLHVSPFRADGVTYGTPTWIWSVIVDDQLYVRPYYGPASRWYRSAMSQRAGRIAAAGGQWEVTFEAAAEDMNEVIDAAYRQKYAGDPYLSHMIGSTARAATVRISPRSD
jgi:hypothetical protein